MNAIIPFKMVSPSLGKWENKEDSLQTLHVYSTLKRRGNERFDVVSKWNTSGVFVVNKGFNV